MNETARTIFALSSGAPPAAIAIVRISGPEAAAALGMLAGALPPPRRAVLRTVRDAAGERIDRAVLLWFPGPATATGEDLAELHLHGGRVVVAATLDALAALPGCRPARAGEFTRRAFDNGRIDLLQAEGLADLLSAETEDARRRALRLAEGGLSRLIGGWRDRLTMLGARVEAILEFGGDDPDIAPDPAIAHDIAALGAEIGQALASAPAERLRDGVRVVLAGPPNSGKSTLLNALAAREVAIATPVPGTTRDLLEAPVLIEGMALILIDSAGLRRTTDDVERIGIDRAHGAIAAADIVLWLGAEAPPSTDGEVLRVATKADLAPDVPAGAMRVSAVTGEGLDPLRAAIVERARALLPAPMASFTASQRVPLADALAALRDAMTVADETIVAEQLRSAAAALDFLTGRYAVEPMLDALFGRFCIGK